MTHFTSKLFASSAIEMYVRRSVCGVVVGLLCLTWSHKPADRPALRKGVDVAKRLRVRYAVTKHVNLYVPKFKGSEDGSVFCRAAEGSSIERETTTLPGTESAGLFRVEAKRYGAHRLERVLAIARPTA